MIPDLLTLSDLPDTALAGQAVLVRVDFNVPMDGDRITDTTRIEAALPTLRELRERGAKIVLASHRGRPAGEPDAALSLRPVAKALAELDCGAGPGATPVHFVPEVVGDKARAAVDALEAGAIAVLENLRFHPGEKACDGVFSKQLSELASVYVSDAFGTVHRAHASTAGVAREVRHRAAGRLIEHEVRQLRRLLEEPEPPYLAILGGAKISGKIDTLLHLVERIDGLVLGGGVANTFLAARGIDLGGSLVEEDRLEVARTILARCQERKIPVELPADLVTTSNLAAAAPNSETTRITQGVALSPQQAAVDIGPLTVERYRTRILEARTLFWNGPLGVFEKAPFDRGSLAVAAAVAACQGFTVLGGGETGAVARATGVLDRVDHVSTGGGASLALLAGKTLPGLEAVALESSRRVLSSAS